MLVILSKIAIILRKASLLAKISSYNTWYVILQLHILLHIRTCFCGTVSLEFFIALFADSILLFC